MKYYSSRWPYNDSAHKPSADSYMVSFLQNVNNPLNGELPNEFLSNERATQLHSLVRRQAAGCSSVSPIRSK